MASALDRRLRQLEASRAPEGDTAVRVCFVHPGQDHDKQIAEQLGELRPSDIVVTFVGVGDVPPLGEPLQ